MSFFRCHAQVHPQLRHPLRVRVQSFCRALGSLTQTWRLAGGMAACLLPALSASGAGFFVEGGLLFDANGNEFIMRGIAHPHIWYASQTAAAIPNIAATGANCVRLVLGNGRQWGPNTQADVAALIQSCKANRLIAIPEVHDCTGFGDTGGFAPLAAPLSTAVDYWISIQPALMGQEAFVILNIANEPFGNGPPASTWVNEHITAITRLRAAGFTHTLLIDAANWGQDWSGISRANAQTVFNADPLGNVVFAIHMYEVYQTDAVINSYMTTFITAGLPLIVGEFGATHGANDVNEGAIMQRAEQYGLGYIGWSWSGNGGGVEALDVAINFNPATLSSWGNTLINGLNGIAATSQICSVFPGAPQLKVSPTSIAAPLAGGNTTVTVTSNQGWTVSDNQTWITVAPTSGTANGSFTISVAPNALISPRTGIVAVTGSTLTRNITVTQVGTGGPGVCANPAAITLPHTQNGAGDFCWVTSGNISSINTWNLQSLEINGVNLTNVFVNAANLPARINGNYYIRYQAGVSFAHFEAAGSGGGGNTLSVAPTSLSFAAAAASSPLSVTSNVSWTVTDDQTWITVTPTSGANNATITVSAAANTGTTARTGAVTVSGGGLTQSITVTQAGVPVNTLTVAPTSLSLAAAASSATVAVTSNVSWTATDNQTWITVAPATGSNNGSITVSATANTGAARSGVVTLTGGGLTATVAVTQAAGSTLTVSPTSLAVGPPGGSFPLIITSTGSWSITDSATWITVAPTSGTGNATVTVTVAANTATTARSATISITGSGLTQTVGVTQEGLTATTLTVSPTSLSLAAAGGSSTITVTSNTSWTVTDDQPWISIAVPSGTNNGSFVVVAAANTATTSRSGTVTVAGGGLTRLITVTQAGAGTTPCANPVAITLPFARDGAGDFCYVTAGTINFINSWNMQLLEVNGVVLTNLWVSGANLPPRINGNYYIRYVGVVPWAHFEATGSP